MFNMTANTIAKLLSADETAALLGIAPHTLAVWRCEKRQALTYVKIGGRVRYRPADVERFITSNMQQAPQHA